MCQSILNHSILPWSSEELQLILVTSSYFLHLAYKPFQFLSQAPFNAFPYFSDWAFILRAIARWKKKETPPPGEGCYICSSSTSTFPSENLFWLVEDKWRGSQGLEKLEFILRQSDWYCVSLPRPKCTNTRLRGQTYACKTWNLTVNYSSLLRLAPIRDIFFAESVYFISKVLDSLKGKCDFNTPVYVASVLAKVKKNLCPLSIATYSKETDYRTYTIDITGGWSIYTPVLSWFLSRYYSDRKLTLIITQYFSLLHK